MSTRGRDAGGEEAYAGASGATRFDSAFVPATDGSMRRVDLVRVVNAATDPTFAEAARAGTLHTLDDGSSLAVPYVYHDPGARRFVLVVPPARAHEELSLRGELLQRLAADTTERIPSYVREATSVIGTEGLRAHLAGADRRLRAELENRLESVSQREERLRDRAEEVTRREDELLHRIEEVDVQKTDLQVREQELESRLAEILAREEALAEDERLMRANKNAQSTRDRMLGAREEALDERERELAARGRELEARETDASTVASARVAIEGALPARELEPLEAEPMEGSADGDSVLDAGDAVDEPTPLPAPLPTDSRNEGSETLEAEEIDQEDLVATPATPTADVPAAWIARGHDAYAAVIDGELRMWAKGGPAEASRLAQGGAVPVLQVDPDGALPLALLTVQTATGDARLARTVLDATRPDDRAVLEALARDFRVRLEIVSHGGRAVGSYAVADQCESNAQRALAVLSNRAPGTDAARDGETRRLLHEGISVRDGEALARAMDDETSMTTAASVETVVADERTLLDATQRQKFLLSHGIPPARLDAFTKRLVLAAMRSGVPLSSDLAARAVELGIAPDERTLAARALTAYARTCEGGTESTGRTATLAARAWSPLLAWAGRVGASIPEAASVAVRNLYDPDDPEAEPPSDPRTPPNAESLAGLSDTELAGWIDHPQARDRVASELAKRDAARHASLLARALRTMPPQAAAELVASLVPAGDALGDLWVELLGSKRTGAAALAAAAVVQIKLRRGLNPLVQRTLAKGEKSWMLFAWASGEFGNAAVRALGRFEEPDPERLSWILAHAVRAGAGRDVEKARTSGTHAISDAATRAVGRVDEARAFDAALRQGHASNDVPEPVARLFQRIAGAAEASVKSGSASPSG